MSTITHKDGVTISSKTGGRVNPSSFPMACRSADMLRATDVLLDHGFRVSRLHRRGSTAFDSSWPDGHYMNHYGPTTSRLDCAPQFEERPCNSATSNRRRRVALYLGRHNSKAACQVRAHQPRCRRSMVKEVLSNRRKVYAKELVRTIPRRSWRPNRPQLSTRDLPPARSNYGSNRRARKCPKGVIQLCCVKA